MDGSHFTIQIINLFVDIECDGTYKKGILYQITESGKFKTIIVHSVHISDVTI